MGANGKKNLRRSKHHRPFPKQKPEYRKLRPLEPGNGTGRQSITRWYCGFWKSIISPWRSITTW